MSRSLSFADFVSRARVTHGDTYFYHEETFVAANQKVRITCPLHGDFEQRADMHMAGQKCKKCGYAARKTPVVNSARKRAQQNGQLTYSTGLPCPKGHVTERRTHNGECMECMRQSKAKRAKKLREEHPEIAAEYKRRDYQNNKDAYRKRTDAWRKDNPEKISEMNRRWREANKEQFNDMVQDWRRRNPAKTRQQKYRRRMLEETAPGQFTEADIERMLDQQNGLCNACKCDIVETFTIDHKVPLSRQGTNDPDNIHLLCRSCNSSKGTKTMEEWLPAADEITT